MKIDRVTPIAALVIVFELGVLCWLVEQMLVVMMWIADTMMQMCQRM